MSEESNQSTVNPEDGTETPAGITGNPPDGAQEEPPAGAPGGDGNDWKAIARSWEDKARRYKEKADRLDEIEEAGKSDLQKATERADKAESELAKLQATHEHETLVNRIAVEKGVPASLLTGDDEQSIEASADALIAWNKSTRPGFPQDTGGSSNKQPVTVESIESIDDPVARVRARAANQHLYG